MNRRGSRGPIIAIILIGILIFGGIYFAYNTVADISQPVTTSGPSKTISIMIQDGESTAQIASDLQAKGLIRNALTFRILARVKGLDTHLQSGAYDHLNTSMTIDEIINQLLLGQPDRLAVSIPEGYRIEQIANQFAAAGLVKFDKQEFLKYTNHPNQFPDAAKYPILASIAHGHSMEGLLYPDTYLVPTNGTARDVVNLMLTEFTTTVQQNHLDTLAQTNRLTTYQLVVLASLVQREELSSDDAPGIASVFWNRIYRPNNETVGFLDADPTVQYARDTLSAPQKYWQPLQGGGGKDIAAGSLWNTYTHKGFPPTPICSPGLLTLKAAASFPRTDYYYFLTRMDNGRAIFAKTLVEFQKDEQKYLKH